VNSGGCICHTSVHRITILASALCACWDKQVRMQLSFVLQQLAMTREPCSCYMPSFVAAWCSDEDGMSRTHVCMWCVQCQGCWCKVQSAGCVVIWGVLYNCTSTPAARLYKACTSSRPLLLPLSLLANLCRSRPAVGPAASPASHWRWAWLLWLWRRPPAPPLAAAATPLSPLKCWRARRLAL
jgi:hypothetical protein